VIRPFFKGCAKIVLFPELPNTKKGIHLLFIHPPKVGQVLLFTIST